MGGGGKYPKGWPKSILFVWELRFLCQYFLPKGIPYQPDNTVYIMIGFKSVNNGITKNMAMPREETSVG